MAIDEGLVDWVREALEPIGTVTLRKMMGAAVLYCDGLVFAVVDGSDLYFKSDATSAAIWDEAGCGAFTIPRDGEQVPTNYRTAPTDVYDDADAMREWAAIAIEAGRRAAAKKKSKR